MNIIFGDAVKLIPDSFTVLELDTFYVKSLNEKITAWCVIENIPLIEFVTLDAYRRAHGDLMENYRARNWEFCESAIGSLIGRWNGECDSFYFALRERIQQLKNSELTDDWDATIERQEA